MTTKLRHKKTSDSKKLQQEAHTASPQDITPPTSKPPRTPEQQALIDQWRRQMQAVPQVAVHNGASGPELRPPINDHELWVARLAQALGTADPSLMEQLLSQVSHCVLKVDAEKALNTAVAAIAGIAPRDQLEALLAVQMVSVHNTALELIRRVLIQDQTVEGVSLGVHRATQLLRTFTAQVETLVRYRTRGQQKVVVEHVHVERGGQAIVGMVHHNGGRGDNAEE